MKFRFLAVAFAICQLIFSASLVSAGESGRILSPGEKRLYHACLYAAYIERYCRSHAWPWSEAAFRECVIANGAGRIVGPPYWGWGTYRTCRELAQRGL